MSNRHRKVMDRYGGGKNVRMRYCGVMRIMRWRWIVVRENNVVDEGVVTALGVQWWEE